MARSVSVSSSLVLALLVTTLSGSADAQPVADEIVGLDVLEELVESDGPVRVMIAFDVPQGAGPAGLQALGTPEFGDAIDATCESIVRDFAPGEFELIHRFRSVNAMAGEITLEGLARLLADERILRVDLDEGGSGHLDEARPLTNVDVVQGTGLTGAGITVGVIDTGYDTDHADLSDNLTGERCFCAGGTGCCPDGTASQSGAGSAEDDHGHGTNVSGVVTSRGTIAPLGGAPDADVVAVKVLDNNGNFCCSSDVIAGLNWIINNRSDVDIVNMSLGTNALYGGNCDNADANTMAYAAAINTLRNNGVSVFVSSGNNGSGTQMPAPACVANAISVGAVWDSDVGSQTVLGCTDATTAADQVTCFSNSNATTDIFAPGAPMLSTGVTGGTSTFFGTSQASPLAAACAALLLEDDPTLTPADIEVALEASPTLVTDATNGLSFPRVDCLDALANLPPVAQCTDATAPTDPFVCSAAIVSIDDGSFDPEGGPITLDQAPPGPYALGTTPVVLTVTDDAGATDSCSADVSVFDDEDPVISCPASIALECQGPDGVPGTDPAIVAFLAGASASDNCDPSVSIADDAPSVFGLGTTPVTFTAGDDAGNTQSCSANVVVADTTPPSLSVDLDPDSLWPPNHKLRTIQASIEVADVCDPSPQLRLVSVVSNEPDNGLGDGNTIGDIQGADLGSDDREFELRAERSGRGRGRVYTASYEAEDASGNVAAPESAAVSVAKSRGK
ncbi:MAG: S8 family serine peptidase [Deltaproteobacteria bacterium]|nr:S8 family serine peptidase [Deltaproteobacteria bacterium]